MGVIWLCGVCPAGYTRTLIFYVLTIQFFTPAEQLHLTIILAKIGIFSKFEELYCMTK